MRINDEALNFTAKTSQGMIDLHRRWMGYRVLASKNFTPVCTTRLRCLAGLEPEFSKHNCKIIGLNVDR
jgi:thioredoxin-dependent peroxiredoxin